MSESDPEFPEDTYLVVDVKASGTAEEIVNRRIQAGIDDLEAGRLIPLAEADAEIREQLGFTPRPS